MKINRNNYEVFLIDYLDGTLDAALEAELMLFLEAHPDIREEMNGLEDVSLQSQSIRFSGKDSLKKTEIKTIAGIGEENYEEYFVAFYDNELSAAQQADMDKFLTANPQLKAVFKLHEKLLLQKDESVVFPYKVELKKKPAIGIWWLSASGVAAAIALLFALFNLLKPGEVIRKPGQMAVVYLAPKTVDNITTNNAAFKPMPSGLSERKALKKVRPVLNTRQKLESPDIAQLERRTIVVNLSDGDDYETFMQPVYKTEYLIATISNVPPKEKKKSVLGRVINHNLKLLAERFPKKDKINKSDPAFVKILDGSITAFNTITGSEVEMQKEYDNNGHLKAYQIEGEMLNVSRSIPDPGNIE